MEKAENKASQSRHTHKLCSTTSTSLSLFSPGPSAEETEPAGHTQILLSLKGLLKFRFLHWRVSVQILCRCRLTFPESI